MSKKMIDALSRRIEDLEVEKQADEEENDFIRKKLIEAEKGGFSEKSSDQILNDIKGSLNKYITHNIGKENS